MTMTHEERTLIARAALLNTESEAYVNAYNDRVSAFMRDCPPQRLEQLTREYPDECTAITKAVPTAAQLMTLDLLMAELRRFSDMPSEDRGYVASCFMQLHDSRELLLKGYFLRAQQEADAAAARLHWVACERKRNNVRAAHRMPDPDTLKHLDALSHRIDIWAHRLARPSKVVA